MTDPVLAHLERETPAIVERLKALVAIPSVSTDPAYADGMAQAREVLTERLRQMGLSGIGTIDAGGHPAVVGEWHAGADRPTLLVYGHYDVQPPDPVDKWRSPPFEPTVRDGRLYGRGVSDDKGPASIALESMAAFLRVEGKLPVNVKVLLEGEEELGSATLGDIIRAHRDRLAVDAVLSADGARWRADLVTVNVGSRGNAGFEMTVRSADKDLHSGRFGGAVPNALHAVADLVSALHDENGAVAVPGFYDDAPPIDAAERAALAAIPFDEQTFLACVGAVPVGEPGYSTLERLWLRPCLDVNGLWGGYTGPGGKTVIANEAHAKLTLRLARGQDPARASERVKAFLAARCPPGCTLEFHGDRGQSAAYEVPSEHPLLLGIERVLTDTHGAAPHRVRIGATLPVADIVRRELGVDTITLSYSTADEDFHAPNEFFRLSSIDEGLAAWTRLWRQLAGVTLEDFAPYR